VLNAPLIFGGYGLGDPVGQAAKNLEHAIGNEPGRSALMVRGNSCKQCG
jgi:hypothetical protein